MTIEGRGAHRHFSRVGHFTRSLALILAVWFVVMAVVPRLLDEPGQYILVGPQLSGIEAITTTKAKLVSSGFGYIQVEGASQGFVSQLYDAGAWLVLPASNGGCFSLRDWQRLVRRSGETQH